ncbi:ABC transporter permease [Sodalis ligni]|jgi:ABC-type dipeptide/oligopeptide/nickel transport system permease subunit|uniref:Peptide/nickel transport system permease protein/glutathione transport system permease protein n=1 Tax=Sodalis ligni TaxID=2697027 RepID=A0A4R1N6P4_9GAMM|nr:ABC transporter permease [Sodalis ligni]TCL02905.1 peptide/nickel transport system permease protein/glutathione transport system permease protein [Sodalis ligni]
MSVASLERDDLRAPRRRFRLIKAVMARPSGLFGFTVVALITLAAVLAPWLAPCDPATQFAGLRLAAAGTAGHPLGTDELSRDLLSRVLFGARISLLVGFVSVAAGAGLGIIVGLISGMGGRFVDTLLMRACDILLAYPGILLGVIAVAILGPGLIQICIAVAFVNLPLFARLMRASVLRERELDYVKAAVAQGTGLWRIMLRHVMPNGIGVVISQLASAAGHGVLLEASLSFIGLGIRPPSASWGTMLSGSRDYLTVAPLYAVVPGLLLMLLVLGLNLLGDAMQKSLDSAGDE